MATSLQKSQPKQSNIQGKIKVEGNMDERQDVIVCSKTATLKWEGFKSLMVLWTKVYERI